MKTTPSQQLIDALKGKFVAKSQEAKEVFEKIGYPEMSQLFWDTVFTHPYFLIDGFTLRGLREAEKVTCLSEIESIIASHTVTDATDDGKLKSGSDDAKRLDDFAGLAMQGEIASQNSLGGNVWLRLDNLAERSYSIAQAMLTERSKHISE